PARARGGGEGGPLPPAPPIGRGRVGSWPGCRRRRGRTSRASRTRRRTPRAPRRPPPGPRAPSDARRVAPLRPLGLPVERRPFAHPLDRLLRTLDGLGRVELLGPGLDVDAAAGRLERAEGDPHPEQRGDAHRNGTLPAERDGAERAEAATGERAEQERADRTTEDLA